MQCADGFIRDAGQVLGADVERLRERYQRVDGPLASVIGGEVVAGDRFVEVERPGPAVFAWFDPAFQAPFAADVEAGVAVGVLGVRYNHEVKVGGGSLVVQARLPAAWAGGVGQVVVS